MPNSYMHHVQIGDTNFELQDKKNREDLVTVTNRISQINSDINEIRDALDNVSINPDDLGLYQDENTFYVYPTYKGVRSENGIPLAGGGGGGGGGDIVGAVFTVENTTGWLSKTIVSGYPCITSFTWSSIEDGFPTGEGSIRITVNDIVRTTKQIQQGNVSVDIASYLTIGTNKVKIRISDTYDQGKTITFNITAIELSISSQFDSQRQYEGAIPFTYTPVGAVEKTVNFYVDGVLIGTNVTSITGRQMSFQIPAQQHGAHSLRVFFTAVINDETVTSNELYYEFMTVDPSSSEVIIACPFNQLTWPQFSLVPIPFQVYDPSDLTAPITIKVNNVVVSEQTVDRSRHTFTYRATEHGTKTVKLQSGYTIRTITFTVTESEINVTPETDALALYLTSMGRSNNEEHPGIWRYENDGTEIAASFTGFNWASDGWQTDADGATCLRVSGAARVTIPYKPFLDDFRAIGKTIEIEFATRNVVNYDASILTCMDNGRGLNITAQKATLTSEQSEISTQYKEDEHIRIAFVAEKRSENRLLMVYINGIPSGVVQYPDNDDFSQISPADITIGSNDCTIDIYNIRIYDNNLNGNQILDNWIADTSDGTLMLERYARNTVYDQYGKIVAANLPADLPYFILNAPKLPQFKGDKKTISGSYVDRMFPANSFTFTGCQINVQGTSSAVYARKNYDLQFKNGFDMESGSHADKYTLAEGIIPFNRFVLKADVASSEGANNVELVKLYNDACPYKTPEMVEDERVRWGIYGFPIVVFWNNTDTQEISFLGKYNFNLPKRAPAPYGYANDDTMESWEFQNNTSDLMLFKTDYFDQTMYTDPDTGDTKELWRYDYEARFPDDTWTDYRNLQEFQSFVYSTYRARATGDPLSQSVTYEGVEYTNDTREYRLARFRAEFPTYAELNSFLFYYIFTEVFLMVDSRAKNLFIGFNGSRVTVPGRSASRKATAQPYDMDTAIGTNNEGTLVFDYALEDTDHLSGGDNIFNGQESVLWCNIRDAYETEIRLLYQSLRSAGVLSYSNVENRFEAHQIKWPEAVWIEDSRFKYIDPLINPDEDTQSTADYLSMLQGSKAEQRKWWLVNRFKYMDSKWNAGDALSQVIILRGYEKADITITPYTDIYPTIKYASYVVQARGRRGQPTTLPCPLDQVSDTEISIYSAPQLASVGDLAPLKVGFVNFSEATKLKEIKIGDASNTYDNRNLYSLTLDNNTLLKKLDVRNCSGFGDTSLTGHTQTVVDISKCSLIEEIYFEGTKIQGVTLPNGGNIKILHLPATITNLTILNQKYITDLSVAGYSNISTLRIENSSVDSRAILESINPGSRVRLIGFTWEAENAAEIDEMLNRLDSMRGLDESGGNMDIAQVSGIIHTATLTGAQIASYNSRYPFLRITADYITSVLTFKTYDGSETIKTVACLNGELQDTAPTVPPRANSEDGHYTYTPVGWNKNLDSKMADPSAIVDVIADRTVYAAYIWVTRSYTVTWINTNTAVLETDYNIPWGTIPTYNGATPTYDGQVSTGWSPEVAAVTGDITYTAVYLPTYTARFVRANVDGGGTLYTQNRVVQGRTPEYRGETPTTTQGSDVDFTFIGWSPTPGPMYADTTYTALFRDNRSVVIRYLNKTLETYESDTNTKIGQYAFYGQEMLTEVRAPITLIEQYAFAQCSKLEKVDLTNTSPVTIGSSAFHLSNLQHLIIRSTTKSTLNSISAFSSVNFALCKGAVYVPTELVDVYKADNKWRTLRIEPIANYPITEFETISDSWAEIFEAEEDGSYLQKYKVGDTKEITINDVTGYAIIIGMNEDILASDHVSTAKITWFIIPLIDKRRMNPTGDTTGGWETCELRAWLRDSVLPTIDPLISSHIKAVDKTFIDYVDGQRITRTVADTLWIPSYRELSTSSSSSYIENSGTRYNNYIASSPVGMKFYGGSRRWWWLRTAYSSTSFYQAYGDSGFSNAQAAYTGDYVCVGFCT